MVQIKTLKQKIHYLWNNVNKNAVDITSLEKKDNISHPRTFIKKINTLEYVLVQISDLTDPGHPNITYKLFEDNNYLQNLIQDSANNPFQDVTSNYSLQNYDNIFMEVEFNNLPQSIISFLNITPILETEESFPFPNGLDINNGGIIPEFNYWWKKIPNQNQKGYILKMRLQLYIDEYEEQEYPLYFRLKISAKNLFEWQEIEKNKV